jgi:hypothetical protein
MRPHQWPRFPGGVIFCLGYGATRPSFDYDRAIHLTAKAHRRVGNLSVRQCRLNEWLQPTRADLSVPRNRQALTSIRRTQHNTTPAGRPSQFNDAAKLSTRRREVLLVWGTPWARRWARYGSSVGAWTKRRTPEFQRVRRRDLGRPAFGSRAPAPWLHVGSLSRG